jgi:hypothetical protein
MGAVVTTVQSALNFGGVAAGSSGPDIIPVSDLPSFNGGIEINDAPADAMLSVTLTGDTQHFFIRDVYVLEWTWEEVDTDELPYGHYGPRPLVKVLAVANFSDGTIPVQVLQGQFVLIRTGYVAGMDGGAFNATITIQGDTWNAVNIPLSFFIADVKTLASRTLNIAQGQHASLPFIIQSLAGPDIDVYFEMSPTQLDNGLTLAPNNFSLASGTTETVLLEFIADANAPIGCEQVALDQYAFGRQGFFFTANIVHADITVNALIPNKIPVQKRSISINLPISIQLNNGPAIDANFTGFCLLSDVSINGASFYVETDQTINLNVFIGDAVYDQFSFLINWTTQWGQTGAMYFDVIIEEPETISVQTSVVTADGIPLGGWLEMILQSNGNYTFHGWMGASGIPSYDYGLQVFLKAADGVILTAFNSGSVYGTDTAGSRENSWDENLNSVLILSNWLSIRNNPVIEYQLNASIGGILGTVWDVMKIALEAFVAFLVAGPIGTGIVLGNQLLAAANITPPPGIVAGIGVVEGSVIIFGPGAIVPAVVAGAVAGIAIELAIKNRPIRDDEKDFARLVLGNVLDEKFNENKVWITNLSYNGGTKYTIPNLDGLILLNLDDEAYDDPINYANPDPNSDYTQPGSVFIHELTHACQIAVNKFLPGLICTGSGTYTYHIPDGEANRLTNPQWANLSWTEDFTREQQAHIVDDWYGAYCFAMVFTKDGDFWKEEKQFFRNLDELKSNLNSEVALNDPAFHFIINCRSGIF